MKLQSFSFEPTHTYSFFKKNEYEYNFVIKDFISEDILDISFLASATQTAELSFSMVGIKYAESVYDIKIIFNSFDLFLEEINSYVKNDRLKFTKERLLEILNPLIEKGFFVD